MRLLPPGFGREMDAREREDLRWYFEDYIRFPIALAPAMTVCVESIIG